MIFSMMKKASAVLALGFFSLMAMRATSAGSYVSTAIYKVRHAAQDAVPVQFEIDRARHEVDALTPAIREHIEQMARAEEDVRGLENDIADTTANLSKQKTSLLALRKQVDDGQIHKVGGTDNSRQIQESLRNRLDTYNRCERILDEKKATLASRQKVVESAREHLSAIATQKKALEAKIEEIEARLAAIEASNANSKYHFDGSALARAKQSVADLDRRLNVVSRVSEMEGRLTEDGTIGQAPAPVGDPAKEIDAKFGTKATEAAEKGSAKL
jgi:chromosome segregation ATPase